MNKAQRSRTAEGAAAMRASHILYEDPIIFADPFALSLLTYPWQRAIKNRWLHKLVFGVFMRPLIPIQGQVLGRARFTEDRVLHSIRTKGVQQVVVIGAGLDTFCLRHPELASSVTVFEIDHPATQAYKKKRLAKLPAGIPKNLEFIAANLEVEELAEVLKQSNFDAHQPAIFYWLGVTVYLTKEAIFATISALSEQSATGSELIFDYAGAVDKIPASERANVKLLQFYTQRFGEPIIDNHFVPTEFVQQVCELGYKLLENMSPQQQKQTYFLNRTDRLRPVSGSYFVHFEMI